MQRLAVTSFASLPLPHFRLARKILFVARAKYKRLLISRRGAVAGLQLLEDDLMGG